MGGNIESEDATVASKTNPQKERDWLLFVFAIFALVVILGFYFFNFYCSWKWSNVFSKDPANWGQFADFVGGLMNPLLSIIVLWTLIKTLRYSAQTLNDARKDRIEASERIKKQNTFDFSLTFNSKDMMQSRLLASKILKDPKLESFDLNKLKKKKDYVHLGNVLTFFKQLNVLEKSKLIDRNLSAKLFGSYYVHFKPYFEKIIGQTETDFDGLLYQIENLGEWMPKDYEKNELVADENNAVEQLSSN